MCGTVMNSFILKIKEKYVSFPLVLTNEMCNIQVHVDLKDERKQMYGTSCFVPQNHLRNFLKV